MTWFQTSNLIQSNKIAVAKTKHCPAVVGINPNKCISKCIYNYEHWVQHGSSTTFETKSYYCVNLINWVQRGSSTTFETGLSCVMKTINTWFYLKCFISTRVCEPVKHVYNFRHSRAFESLPLSGTESRELLRCNIHLYSLQFYIVFFPPIIVDPLYFWS